MSDFFLPCEPWELVYASKSWGLRSLANKDSGQDIVEFFQNTRALGEAVIRGMA